VLLLTPLRSLALAAAARLAALAQAETRADSIQGAGRLAEEFGPGSDDEEGAAPGAARPRASPPSTPRCSPATQTTTSASASRSRGAPAARLAEGPRACARAAAGVRTAGPAPAGGVGLCAARGRTYCSASHCSAAPRRACHPVAPSLHLVRVQAPRSYMMAPGCAAPGRAPRALAQAPLAARLSRCGCAARRRGSVRLFAEFFQSDIIVASPLGLATALAGAAGEGDGAGDFLSSVEVAVADRADVMLMQNWAHVATGAPRATCGPAALRTPCESTGVLRLQGSLCLCGGSCGAVLERVRACGTASLRPCRAPPGGTLRGTRLRMCLQLAFDADR